MSNDETVPKKAARKRVVKKGVRGTRAPRKKTVLKEDEAEAVASDDSDEVFSLAESSESEAPAASSESADSADAASQIEVVEESPTETEKSEAKPKSNKRGGRKKEDDSERSDQSESEGSENSSGDDGGERNEGRNRRGRNRRGSGSRDREENAPKRSAVDKDEAAAKAWEIYQGELEEEGVSLVDPRRAREVARRCLELATIFCEERDRYLNQNR